MGCHLKKRRKRALGVLLLHRKIEKKERERRERKKRELVAIGVVLQLKKEKSSEWSVAWYSRKRIKGELNRPLKIDQVG